MEREKDVRVGRASSAHANPMSESGQFKNPSPNTVYPFVPFGRTIHCSRLVSFGRTPPNAYRAPYTVYLGGVTVYLSDRFERTL